MVPHVGYPTTESNPNEASQQEEIIPETPPEPSRASTPDAQESNLTDKTSLDSHGDEETNARRSVTPPPGPPPPNLPNIAAAGCCTDHEIGVDGPC